MLRPGHVIALCVLALLTIGVVMVNSALMTVGAQSPVSIQGILTSRSVIYMALALGAMLVTSQSGLYRLIPGSRGSMPAPVASGWSLSPLWLVAGGLIVIMAAVYVPGLRHAANGSHRWVRVGSQSMQPSEIAKWGLIFLMAWYAWRAGPTLGRFFKGLMPALVCTGLVAGFIVIEDLGTGVLVGAVACCVLIAGGAKIWHFALWVPVGAAGFAAAVLTNPYRLHRIQSFLDPYQDPQGKGYHMIQSMVAVANGQVFGRGLGHGLQKFDYLPEDHTDFIFAVICEELGVPGAGAVIFLYVALIWAGFLVVRRQRALVHKLVGIGIVCTVGIQAIINLAVVTGMGPTKGIALPLLSFGGTGWILTAASLGLLVAMDLASARQEQGEVEPALEATLPEPAPACEPGAGGATLAPGAAHLSALPA